MSFALVLGICIALVLAVLLVLKRRSWSKKTKAILGTVIVVAGVFSGGVYFGEDIPGAGDNLWCVGVGCNVWSGNILMINVTEDDVSSYIILNGTQNNTNIAQGKTAFADSEFSASYIATKALDENIATSWVTEDGVSLPTNWTVDLGANLSIWNITALQSHLSNYRIKYYGLLISKNNLTYSVLLGNTSADSGALQEQIVMKNNSIFVTRYIRIKTNVVYVLGAGMCEVYVHKNDNFESGNLTSWHDATPGYETHKLSINFTFPTNTNASINLYNNDTGAFIETLASHTTTEVWSADITSPIEDSKVNVTLYGNVTKTPEVHNITFHTQAVAPDITSWSNDYTNDASVDFSCIWGSNIKLNATANQTITTWNWYVNDSNQNHNFDNFTYYFNTTLMKEIAVNATNTNGTSNFIQWNVTSNIAPEIQEVIIIT